MLHYPKIPGIQRSPRGRCIAFEKYDGTNLHWDWDRDFGWHAFGTRRDVFNLNAAGIADFARQHAQLRACAALFQASLAEPLERIFRVHPTYAAGSGFKVFTEFFGPRSFAGLHQTDDPYELRLFDVGRYELQTESLSLVPPQSFVADFAALSIARVVYEGPLTGQFTEDVRAGRYGVAEGVVCKGSRSGEVWMVKIKTHAYLARLQAAFARRWEEYWE